MYLFIHICIWNVVISRSVSFAASSQKENIARPRPCAARYLGVSPVYMYIYMYMYIYICMYVCR